MVHASLVPKSINEFFFANFWALTCHTKA